MNNKNFDRMYDYEDFIPNSNRSVRDFKRIYQKRKRKRLNDAIREEMREMEESYDIE